MHAKEIKRVTIRNITDREFFYGHKACPGCGASLAVRLALKAIGERSYSVLPAFFQHSSSILPAFFQQGACLR